MLQQKLASAKKEYNVLSNMYDTAVEKRDLILQGGRVQLKKAKAKYEAYTQSLMADYQAASDKVCHYSIYTGVCLLWYSSTAVCFTAQQYYCTAAVYYCNSMLCVALCLNAVCTVLSYTHITNTKHTSFFYAVLLYTIITPLQADQVLQVKIAEAGALKVQVDELQVKVGKLNQDVLETREQLVSSKTQV
jgi:hypothetical protein